MTVQTVWNSTIFPVVGLSVTFAIALMTMGLLELPAEIGWAAIFLMPMVGFGVLLQRNHRGSSVNHRAVTTMVLLIVPVGIIVPRVDWDGIGVMGLAAISIVAGIIVGALVHNSYAVTQQADTEAVV